MKTAKIYKRERIGYMNSINDMRKKTGRHIIGITAIAVIVIAFAVVSTIHMKMEDARITQNYVKNYTDQIAEMISMNAKDVVSTVESLVESIENKRIRKDIQEFLDQKRKVYKLSLIAVYDNQGDIRYSSGDISGKKRDMESLYQDENFRTALKKQQCAVGISNEYVYYAKSIYKDGRKIGTFWVGNQETRLRDIFVTKTLQKENSASFIMNSEGEILLCSDPDKQCKDFTVFVDSKKNKNIQKEVEQMFENIKTGKNGTFEFSSEDRKTYYFAYALTTVNDWVTVTLMPADLFTGFSDQYVMRMLGCVLAVFVVFAAFFLLLYRSYIQNGRHLERLAFQDEITGGINRIDFRMRYQKLCRDKIADQYTLILLDCMDFKLINESLGDRNGDRMLRYFYSVISRFLGENEIVARTEMDHFFILMKETDPQVVERRVYEMAGKIRSFKDTTLPRCDVTFWMGACPVDSNYSDLTILQDSVIAVVNNQSPQEAGKLIYYDQALSEKMQKERGLDSLFEVSLKRGDFQVYLQPKVNFRTGVVVGAEALIRWIVPERGMISPGEFIPLLEENGKICRLDFYVYETVCKMLNRWKKQGRNLLPISVNLSRGHFVEGNLVEELVRIADQYHVDRSLIEFEVTETIFMDVTQIKRTQKELMDFHKYGFRCSLDDFGIGYSSLTLLREFKIDVLKLDRSFFLNLYDSRARDVISTVLDMAEKLNMDTVIEGIENTQQMEYLNTVNCSVVQGFFFSRPLPVREFEHWVDEFQMEDYKTAHNWIGADADVARGKKTFWDKEEERRLGYLENLPVACCTVKVLLDSRGEPYDFLFTYANKAHDILEGQEEGTIIGKRFSEVFENPDPEWYKYYYKTAYEGVPQVFQRYSSEIDKHLLIHTFQTERGSCGSVLLDVSEEYFLSQELERSREEMKHILEETTSLVFQYHPDTGKIVTTKLGKIDSIREVSLPWMLSHMEREELLTMEDLKNLEQAFKEIKDGRDNVSVTIRVRQNRRSPMNWYRLTLFEFREGACRERRVLGYVQNVEAEMERQEVFRKQAQRDSLTGIMNVGTGRSAVEKRLKNWNGFGVRAMFMMDIDDFKKINDTMGHMVGDEMLKLFANTLERTFRSDDIIYRLGGDEFVVFVEDLSDSDAGIQCIMKRFNAKMDEVRKQHPYLSSSVGIFATNKYHSFEDFYREADKALYITKKEGKNRHTVIKDLM